MTDIGKAERCAEEISDRLKETGAFYSDHIDQHWEEILGGVLAAYPEATEIVPGPESVVREGVNEKPGDPYWPVGSPQRKVEDPSKRCLSCDGWGWTVVIDGMLVFKTCSLCAGQG